MSAVQGVGVTKHVVKIISSEEQEHPGNGLNSGLIFMLLDAYVASQGEVGNILHQYTTLFLGASRACSFYNLSVIPCTIPHPLGLAMVPP